MDLFESQIAQAEIPYKGVPLAERLRPTELSHFYGHQDFAKTSSDLMRSLAEQNFLPNLILWGPPGTGKTTFARIIGSQGQFRSLERNAIATGAKELRDLGVEAHNHRLQYQTKTLLFIDEIHRLNKSQQDVLLPFMERGDLTVIGATTENPSYNLNSALLSRSKVLRFKPLETEDLKSILVRAIFFEGRTPEELLEKEAIEILINSAHGDARRLISNIEILVSAARKADGKFKFPLEKGALTNLLGENLPPHDRDGDLHYDIISAFIKSIRGSDPDAAIYYLARMLEGGEDPVFIARRLVILSSEDVGNADPRGLQVAVSGLQAVELVGMPEAAINLAQVTTYLASAPKSNRSYLALLEAQGEVRKSGALPVPDHLRSSKTALSKSLGISKGYIYSHDQPRGHSGQNYLPLELGQKIYYEPSDRGFEKNIQQYQAWVKGKSQE